MLLFKIAFPGLLFGVAALASSDSAHAQSLLDFLIPKTVCFIYHQGMPPSPYVGPDGRAIPLTRQQCAQANEEAYESDSAARQQADQERTADEERAAQEAQVQQQKQAAAAVAAVQAYETRGYKPVTMKDLILDAKIYADGDIGVAVSGFYKLQSEHDQRLYTSYNDLMMHEYQSIDAQYIALLTENGSRPLREYLMECGSRLGCNVTILGHLSQCTETNVFGATTDDFCLVADDIGAEENQ